MKVHQHHHARSCGNVQRDTSIFGRTDSYLGKYAYDTRTSTAAVDRYAEGQSSVAKQPRGPRGSANCRCTTCNVQVNDTKPLQQSVRT